MTAMVLAVMLAAAPANSSADALATVTVKAVSLKAPAAWKRTTAEGSVKFAAPSGNAYFLVDVGTVQRRGMTAEVCIQKIRESIGGAQTWEPLTIDGQPAAVRMESDSSPDGKLVVVTQTFIGCSGRTTWSVVLHVEATRKDRYVPLARKIAESVTYKTP